jgi:threonine/homoserine/homoserine lactone efflux protein
MYSFTYGSTRSLRLSFSVSGVKVAAMPTAQSMLVFALVSLGIVAVPGPSALYVLTRGVAGGRRVALAAVAGVEIASALRVLATAAGLSALLASSTLAVDVVRWSGAAYLAVLGVRALAGASSQRASGPRDGVTRGGIIVGLGNPNMLVFFVALFPRFIHPGGSAVTQILVLGSVFWAVGALWDLGVAWASAPIGAWLARGSRVQAAASRAEAAIFIVLAGWTAVSGA